MWRKTFKCTCWLNDEQLEKKKQRTLVKFEINNDNVGTASYSQTSGQSAVSFLPCSTGSTLFKCSSPASPLQVIKWFVVAELQQGEKVDIYRFIQYLLCLSLAWLLESRLKVRFSFFYKKKLFKFTKICLRFGTGTKTKTFLRTSRPVQNYKSQFKDWIWKSGRFSGGC